MHAITNSSQRIILRRIDAKILENADEILLIKKWRIKHRSAYPGTYEITFDSVKNWLVDYVIYNPKRLLFFIKVDHELIGHIGLNNIEKDSVEISTVARGKSAHAGAMHEALILLLRANKHKKIWLHVMPDNLHAIRFYERNGFRIIRGEGEFLRMEYVI